MGAFPHLAFNKNEKMIERKIPSSSKTLPIVGLGTWQSFDAGADVELRKQLATVLNEMHNKGGQVIDSSPMYGSSEEVVGDLTSKLDFQESFFYATKVWTTGKKAGLEQINSSMQRMGRKSMDLLQIHNLVDWQTHLSTLKNMKESGFIAYWGITHYSDSAHSKLAEIIKKEKPDFAQFNLSMAERNAEQFLLKTAQDNGTAVIINRPFAGGSLFRSVKGKELPTWAKELDIYSWAQFFLKYILGNEAVTCTIPGTSKPHHVIDNMGAGFSRLPNEKEREKMLATLSNL